VLRNPSRWGWSWPIGLQAEAEAELGPLLSSSSEELSSIAVSRVLPAASAWRVLFPLLGSLLACVYNRGKQGDMDLESTDKEENIAYSYEIAERTPQKHFKVMSCQFQQNKN
jgi:hypothetical protein